MNNDFAATHMTPEQASLTTEVSTASEDFAARNMTPEQAAKEQA